MALVAPAAWRAPVATLTLLTHLLPLLDERGIHRETAVIVASMIGPMQVAGRIAMKLYATASSPLEGLIQ